MKIWAKSFWYILQEILNFTTQLADTWVRLSVRLPVRFSSKADQQDARSGPQNVRKIVEEISVYKTGTIYKNYLHLQIAPSGA